MKKIALLTLSLSFLAFANAQTYWQQQVDYKIDVSLNDKEKSLKGFLTLDYTNNSPDKLDFIWFHLWPNAYKDNNTAFAKQVKKDKDGEKRLKSIKDRAIWIALTFGRTIKS